MSIKLSLVLLKGLHNSLFFQNDLHLLSLGTWEVPTKFLLVFCSLITQANTNSSCKPAWCLTYAVNAQQRLPFNFLFPSPRANAKAEEFPLHLSLQAGFFFSLSLLLGSSLLYLLWALAIASHTKHVNGKLEELAHNSLVDFPSTASAFRELSHFSRFLLSFSFFDSKDFPYSCQLIYIYSWVLF